ncbi:MAG: hypothetical protein SF187_05095 [Deltaproteobacteria bacterium]|nr:hypothetical protein [Deltaproteobacteria bacterium]
MGVCVGLALVCACDGITLNVLDGPGACVSIGNMNAQAARSTDEFVNSIGLKPLGLDSSDPRLTESIATLGIRHIILREDWMGAINALDLRGLVTIEDLADASPALAFFGARAEAITFRDNNPVIDAAWGANIRSTQQQLFASVKGNPATRDVIVAGPNIGSDAQIAAAGDLSAWADVGTFFPWRTELWRAPPGLRAETDIARHIPVYGQLPLIAPQTGYDTASDKGVTEAVQAKYVVRMLLEHFRLGVPRTFIADLADQGPPAPGMLSEGIGLLHADGSPKPAFAALTRTIALLADPGPVFVPGRLALTLSPASPTVHQLLLQKRNGVFYLLLWREVESVDADVTEPVVVNLPTPAKTLTLFSPLYGAAPLAQGQGHTFVLDVPDSLAVLVIESACR